MSMQELTDIEIESVLNAIHRRPHDAKAFKRAADKIIFGSAGGPHGLDFARELPRTLTEWRKDAEWSELLIERHQQGSRAAAQAYWSAMSMLKSKVSMRVYRADFERELRRRYGIDIADTGMSFAEIAAQQDSTPDPIEAVRWYGEKYGLTPLSEWP